jgi:long-chain fatty acid transport protein
MLLHHLFQRPRRKPLLFVCLLATLAVAASPSAIAQLPGALGAGYSAAAAGRAGTTAAETGDPIDAMQGNPAGLAGIAKPVLDLGLIGMTAQGSFRNSVDPHGSLSGNGGILPYFAYGSRIGSSRWHGGVSVLPDMLMRANWQYIDPPGTAGVSYGLQNNKSEIIAIRGATGLAWNMGSRFAAGGSVGLVYNRNTLDSPYIFQEQPALAGLKVLLNLHTQGWGWNGSAGAQWQPVRRMRIGVAWKSGTFVQSHGDANGTASALFAAIGVPADPAFHYRAEVDNRLPQTADAGVSFDVTRRIRIDVEGDLTNWSTAFRRLPVKLKEGSNAVINSVAGSSAIEDNVWLRWHNQGTIRFGAEYPAKSTIVVRGGYAYSSNPVPSTTLTPLTAAIFQNQLAIGGGLRSERWKADLAYQAQLPASQSVGQSDLLAGEYDNSHVSAMAQSITATIRMIF